MLNTFLNIFGSLNLDLENKKYGMTIKMFATKGDSYS